MPLVIDQTLITNQARNLQAALTTDPRMRRVMQRHIREALIEARRDMIATASFDNGDPRQSIRSIRTSVYEKVLGGNINIMTGGKAHKAGSYQPPRTLTPGQRGGNRRKPSVRTQQVQSYGPLDRGFILRFVNSGTKTRVIGFRNTVKGYRSRYERTVTRIHGGDTYRTGNRGSIAPRNWFMPSAESQLGTAAASIAEMIEIEAAALARGEK